MNVVQFYLDQQAKRVESECFSNSQRLSRASTMREVKQLSEVHIKSEVRHMPNARSAVMRLEQQAEQRMRILLQEQIEEMEKCETIEELKSVRGKFMEREWVFLRGTFSRVYVTAEAHFQKMLSDLTKVAQTS